MNQPASTEQATEKTAPQLNLADLVNVLQVIKSCAARGAFKADEMSQVGGLYDRLTAFLVSTGALKVEGDTPAESKQ
jgi:hypothetical protein